MSVKLEMENISLNVIPGLKIGHAHNLEAATGCTVALAAEGAVCGVDQRGGAPGTRETDLLRPMHLVDRVHAVLLSGGSAFGLAAADGVMQWLEAQGIGFDVGVAHVPIVPAAVLFDLTIGRADVRPDAAMGYAACEVAGDDSLPQQGNVGAGAGATVGKILGPQGSLKGGLGQAAIEVSPGLWVGAMIAVNCLGDVIAPDTGHILAGARKLPEGYFADTIKIMARQASEGLPVFGNTVIGLVATNATLSKEAANKVAQMAHNGLARTIRPAHTMFDGDTIFALATGQQPAVDVNLVGAYACEAVAQAVVNAVTFAKTLAGTPSLSDLS